jgi:beta-glucosidase
MSENGDFLWGVAIASHQNDGGAPKSDWTQAEAQGRFPHRSGLGTNFREHYRQDLDLLAGALGANAFRLSIEWARLEPTPGQWDVEEVAHLHRVLGAARARGLTVVATLHHFTSPAWIHDGPAPSGWESPRTVAAFARYARFVAKEYGREIDYYLTFNEPTNMLVGGYLAGVIPPFRKSPLAAYRATRGLVEAHERAYEAIHEEDAVARVSLSEYSLMLGTPLLPRAVLPTRIMNAFRQRIVGPDGRPRLAHMDFVSLHYYGDLPLTETRVYPVRPYNFRVMPTHFSHIIKQVWAMYGLPVLIGENGMATCNHQPRADGWTPDRYMVSHVLAVQKAMKDGVPVLGYFWWTLTDNYEWGSFDPRFGLYRVECQSGDYTRHPTPAVETYRRIIAAGGVTPELFHEHIEGEWGRSA